MRKRFLLILPLLLLIFNCETKSTNEPKSPDENPALAQFSAPDTLYLISTVDYFMSVSVSDPQGLTDISTVTCKILSAGSEEPVQIDTLTDDGTRGDIIPNDGIYTAPIDIDFAQGEAGTYTLECKAIDISGNESDSLTHELAIIEGEENLAPIVGEVTYPTTLDLKEIHNFYVVTAQVTDLQGSDDIELVLLQIFSPTDASPSVTDTLYDNGLLDDETAGDGTYSSSISVLFAGNEIGKYTFLFQAYDSAENKSNAVTKIVDVIRSDNDPPTISDLTAADTLQLFITTVSTVLSVRATDPQGVEDIRNVYFNSYKPPDDTPSVSNPFIMVDDGNQYVSGDETAGDGIYSLKIYLPPETPPGDYKFIFEAIDKSDALSNQITHIITILQ